MRLAHLLLLSLLACSCTRRRAHPKADTSPAPPRPTAQPTATQPAATQPVATQPAAQPGAPVWRGTTRLVQLVGDEDRQTRRPTPGQSEARFGVRGTDLGYSFEHKGKVWFLFGDTIPRGGDSVAWTDATEASSSLSLTFLTDASGKYRKVAAEGVSMKGFEVPVSGISLGEVAYVALKTNHSEGASTDATVLTRFDEKTGKFTVVRELSRLPEGRFSKLSMHRDPGTMPGLPPGGPFVFLWGTGVYRKSDAYLALVPERAIETGAGTRYFSGMQGGVPSWSEREGEARPVVEDGTLGDLSVTWGAGRWLMTYDSRALKGVALRQAPAPWGPWSEPALIFDAAREGALRSYIHVPGDPEDGLAGPVIGKKDEPKNIRGGSYAPYVIERFTRRSGDELAVHFVLSTWNPYVVHLMQARLGVR